MRICILIFSFVIYYSALNAQGSNLHKSGCGTTTTAEEMQAVYNYVNHPVSYKTTTSVDTLPLSLHIVGNNAGQGYYSLDQLFTIVCQLNTHYAPANIYFAIKWPITYINNTSYYVQTYNDGYNMMSANNIANSTNVYFVQDPAGNCGYYAPSADGVSIGKNCAEPGSTTVAHEVGHFYGLPHPFNGWEYGTPSNPELVTRGFGANCNYTGDYFCDTWADYISVRWPCPYAMTKYDANGDLYHPDSSLYMGYADDHCATRFSNQQIGRMQNDVHVQRTNQLNQVFTPYSALDTPKIFTPSDTLYANQKSIKWHKVAGAEYYYVNVFPTSLSSNILQEQLTTDTSLLLNFTLVDQGQYTVSVAPLMSKNVCRSKMAIHPFNYTSQSAPTAIASLVSGDSRVTIFPNPSLDGAMTVNFFNVPIGGYHLSIIELTGRSIFDEQLSVSSSQSLHRINIGNVPAGVYLLHIRGINSDWKQKLIIK